MEIYEEKPKINFARLQNKEDISLKYETKNFTENSKLREKMSTCSANGQRQNSNSNYVTLAIGETKPRTSPPTLIDC